MLRLMHMWLRLDQLRLLFTITTRDDFMSSQREVEHIASTYMTINALMVRHLYMDFPIVISPYDGPTIVPFKLMKRTSHERSKSNHLHNEMDVRKGKTTIACGLCKHHGHNYRSCQNMNQVD